MTLLRTFQRDLREKLSRLGSAPSPTEVFLYWDEHYSLPPKRMAQLKRRHRLERAGKL